MVALGDTDPLEWRRLHPASSRAPTHSHAFQMSWRLHWTSKDAFQGLPIRNSVWIPPAVVWSHWATMTLWRGRLHPASSRSPTLSHAFQMTWRLQWTSKDAFQGLPIRNGIRRPPAVVWLDWATLTLWRGANSILPLHTLPRLPIDFDTTMELQNLSKHSKTSGSGVASGALQLSYGRTGRH